MAKVLTISSQTVFGPVGNSAAVPALQAEGHDVLALPTILLSFHPGHGAPSGQRTPAPLMQEMIEKLEKLGALKNCPAVMTGYFADAGQVKVAAQAIAHIKKQNSSCIILVDPVIGDDGALYVPQPVAEAIRDQLVPLATIATPNAFELSWLTGKDVSEEKSTAIAASHLGLAETLITSVPSGDALTTMLIAEGRTQSHTSKRLAHVPHGTGDYLSGLYLAHRLKHLPTEAFHRAMVQLDAAIARSVGSSVLHITG
jgi:pyridoxine kinase